MSQEKIKILYDITYATRGNSGIPGDTRSLAAILTGTDELVTDFLLFPKSYVKNIDVGAKYAWKQAEYLGKAIRVNPGRSALPEPINKIRIFFQSHSPKSKVSLFSVNTKARLKILEQLGLNVKEKLQKIDLKIATISLPSRFARPLRYKPYKLKLSNYDFFIQQQIDPIRVPRKIKHVVRLHDILPITHPEFFDEISVEVFSKGLQAMLKNKRIIWVLDTEASSKEFTEKFNARSFYIPCEVGSKFDNERLQEKKINQIVMINTIEPRKNVRFIIEGYINYRNLLKKDAPLKLVIIGGKGWQEDQLWNDLTNGKFSQYLEFYPYATNDFIETKLRESKFTISGSKAEGFGLPPIEGMLHDCIPIASSIPQHLETLKNHAIFFDPSSSNSLLTALDEAHRMSRKSNKVLLKDYVVQNFGFEVINERWMKLLREQLTN